MSEKMLSIILVLFCYKNTYLVFTLQASVRSEKWSNVAEMSEVDF